MPLSQRSATTATDVQPFCGYVDTTEDALRLIEAARRGILPRVTRRLNELERRSMIRSGAVFVFSVEESGIKRWTEGLAWSQSRISGNFLIYREVTDRSSLRASQQSSETSDITQGGHNVDGHVMLKPNGLIKKTITVKINGSDHHLISYFTQDDVRSGRLHRPTSRPDLMALKIPTELLQSANFRYPLKLETQYTTAEGQYDDADDVNYQRRTMLGQASPHSARMVARTPHLGAGPSPLEISGFSRSSGSSPTSPYASSRASQFDAVYPRLQTDIGHPVSPSGSAHAAHSPYSAAESPVLDDITSPSWSPSYSCGPETYTMSTGAPAMYQAPLPIGHFDSAHLPRDEMWAEQAHSSVRIGRGYEHDMHRLNIGEHPESVWSPAIATVTGSQYASAPPTGVSITSQFPAVRGRDHVRTRSVPPIWSWGQDSAHSLYQLPPVSHPIYASHGARHSPT
ncbi:Gti1/Pac2 family-domain-containing protein [Fomitopsis betulina]|nr:Gti1/Pac2 family-domain-containing protein [Fomitopsis betulina]